MGPGAEAGMSENGFRELVTRIVLDPGFAGRLRCEPELCMKYGLSDEEATEISSLVSGVPGASDGAQLSRASLLFGGGRGG